MQRLFDLGTWKFSCVLDRRFDLLVEILWLYELRIQSKFLSQLRERLSWIVLIMFILSSSIKTHIRSMGNIARKIIEETCIYHVHPTVNSSFPITQAPLKFKFPLSRMGVILLHLHPWVDTRIWKVQIVSCHQSFSSAVVLLCVASLKLRSWKLLGTLSVVNFLIMIGVKLFSNFE